MADADLSIKDNKVTPVTTGLGESSNAVRDSGNADTKPAATAVEPGHNSMNPTVENVGSDTDSESGVKGTDPEADKTTLSAETERLAREHMRNQSARPRFSTFGQSIYGQPIYDIVPRDPVFVDDYVSELGGYGGQQQGYGSFGQSMYARPHYYGGYGGVPQGYGSFGKSMCGQPHHYGMSPQTSYDQHVASPANVGGFGGASANERRTNNGGRSTSNMRYPPTMYMQPGMQRSPMEPQRSQMEPSTYHDFLCLILLTWCNSVHAISLPHLLIHPPGATTR